MSKFNVEKRKGWNVFGSAIDNTNITSTGDDIWMEFNPDILKSNKTRKYVHRTMSEYGGNNTDNSKFTIIGCPENKYDDTMNQFGYNKRILVNDSSNIFCRHCNGNHWSKNCTVKDYYKTLEEIDKKLNKTKDTDTNQETKDGYVAPHLRKKKNNNQDDNVEENENENKRGNRKEVISGKEKSIRISNLPTNITDNGLYSWLSQFNLDEYQLHRPIDKFNGGYRDFGFINFLYREHAERAMEILSKNRVRLSHYIISVEWAKY